MLTCFSSKKSVTSLLIACPFEGDHNKSRDASTNLVEYRSVQVGIEFCEVIFMTVLVHVVLH